MTDPMMWTHKPGAEMDIRMSLNAELFQMILERYQRCVSDGGDQATAVADAVRVTLKTIRVSVRREGSEDWTYLGTEASK